MSVSDSWNWSVNEEPDLDRNNGCTNNFQQNSKNTTGFRNNGGSNNNSQQAQISGHVQQLSGHQNNQRNSGWPQQPYNPQTESPTNFFSNKPPLNNNPYPDVENKEIAPPDHHHHSAGHRHPMKLGSKQPLLQNTAVRSRQDNSSKYSNVHQQQPTSYMQQNMGTSRNTTHHYFSNTQGGMFRSNDDHSGGNSWSYFDQMGGMPPLTDQQQPQSLPPEDYYQDRSSQNEPKNFSYFHNQNPSHTADNNPSSLRSNNETSHHSSQFSDFGKEEPVANNASALNSTSQQPLKEQNQYHPFNDGINQMKEQTQNHLQGNLFNETPVLTTNNNLFDQSKASENVGPPPSHIQEERAAVQLNSNLPRSIDRSDQHLLSHPLDREPHPNLDTATEQKLLPSSHQAHQEGEQKRLEFETQEWSEHASVSSDSAKNSLKNPSFMSQTKEMSFLDTEAHSMPFRHPDGGTSQDFDHEGVNNLWNHDIQPPQRNDDLHPHNRDLSLLNQDSQHGDLAHSQLNSDRLGFQHNESPPLQISDRPISQGLEVQQVPDNLTRSEWNHPPQQLDRPPSQGRDNAGPLPPSQADKAGTQNRKMTGLQSDRPGSQGCDWSSPSGSERALTLEQISHHRTPSQGSDRSGSLGRVSNVRMDGKAEGIANRSPGSGQDRSSPPTRPDNMESLPPDPHINHQMKQLSIQPQNQMGDCPLDRNAYLETSQLSNQESGSNDIRPSRHQQLDSNHSSHRGERREVVGEAEPLGGRVVVGHTTPNVTPPPNHSEEVEGGGSGSMERMVVGERRDQSSRNIRTSRHRNHHRRESSYEEDDPDYSSDNRRGHRDDYRREDRHRKKRGQDRSPDYPSDEDYEIDRRVYSRRDRRGRDRDYSPEYRRDYYREDLRHGGRGREREYYRYEDDDYSFRERSRPSSRSGSDYRRTNLDYNSRNPSRHFYNTGLAGMLGGRDYESNPEYFEMLRKNNPLLYAYWYQDYIMRKLQDPSVQSTFTQSDRASIHSGQSSGNRMHISTPNQALDSNVGNVDSFEEYSPRLFSTPHVRGSYDGQGRLISVNACSPLDGQHATVQILALEPQDLDPDIEEFLHSPGPFIPGVTHRSSVLQYLRKMSDHAEKSSEKLLYDLVHLIVKSNGKPDATDISELLLESYRRSRGDTRDQWDPDPTLPKPISHHDMLSRFRSLLHQGNKQEALDWAMRNGGWGHALYLASKMDSRTQSRVSGEFARSIAASDPLSSLYQAMSGSVPAAATACSDRRWADWRPHLAMILSNLTDKAAVDLATITTLADGLASRGRIHAAHSCHLIAQVMFGEMCKAEGPVLLGWSEPVLHQPNTIVQSEPSVDTFSYKSFLLTLCYEYAIKQSQSNFYIPALQKYKLLIAWRLVEWNKGREALLYCELLASEILQASSTSRSSLQCSDLVHLLIELSSSLKALDPLAPPAAIDLSSAPDADWLQQLKQLAHTLPEHNLEPQLSHHQPEPSSFSNFEPPQHVPMYPTSGGFDGGYVGSMKVEASPMIPEATEPPASSTPAKSSTDMYPASQRQQHQMPQHHFQQPVIPSSETQQPNSLPHQVTKPLSYQQSFSSQPHSYTGYGDGGSSEVVDHGGSDGAIKQAVWEPEQQVEPSSQPAAKSSTSYFQASESMLQEKKDKSNSKPATQQTQSTTEVKKKPEPASGNSGGSWFGGILGKLSMKPKNHMVLPDDKTNPIVYDEKSKLWVDTENKSSDVTKETNSAPPMDNPSIPLSTGNKPPINPSGNPSMPNPGILPPSQPSFTNKYKLQKGKSMKSNYVDILSNTGSSYEVSSNMNSLIPSMGPISIDPANPNYFAPQSDNPENAKGNYTSQVPGDNNYHGQEQ